jgi:hypothetical protein
VPANVGSFAHRGENVVDLMDALRRSIGTAEPAKAAKPSKKPCKAVSGQKEMLMPIAGKKPSKKRQSRSRLPGHSANRHKRLTAGDRRAFPSLE